MVILQNSLRVLAIHEAQELLGKWSIDYNNEDRLKRTASGGRVEIGNYAIEAIFYFSSATRVCFLNLT